LGQRVLVTTSPSGKLDVDGKFYLSGEGSNLVSFTSGSASTVQGFDIQAEQENEPVAMRLFPHGTGVASYIQLMNSSDKSNFGMAGLKISGDTAQLYLQNSGVPTTPVTKWAIMNGNVGIGTTSPGVALDIVTSDAAGIRLYRNSGNSSLHVQNNADDVYFGMNNSNNAAIGHNLDQTNAPFQITSGGNVGIGDTSPDAKLDVAGSAFFDDTGTYTTSYNWAGSTLQTNSVEIMDRYSGSTSDGIYPTLTFHDYGNGGAQFSMEGSTEILHLASGGSNSAGTLATGSDYFSELRVHGKLTATGNVGIGTTSPGYKLDVSGTGRFTSPVIVGTPTSDTHAATKSYVDSATNDFAYGYLFFVILKHMLILLPLL